MSEPMTDLEFERMRDYVRHYTVPGLGAHVDPTISAMVAAMKAFAEEAVYWKAEAEKLRADFDEVENSRNSEGNQLVALGHEHEELRIRHAALVEGAGWLAIEIKGMVGAFDDDIRAVIGHTNANCIGRRLADVQALLRQAKGDADGEGN